MKELKISAIREGTVIDHIPADRVLDVVDILKLGQHDNVMSIATNLPSKKMGKKGILKIGGRYLTKKEVDKISIIASKATISIINNYEVKDKRIVSMPSEFKGIVRCPNPNCVTNKERTERMFNVVKKEPLKIRCNYCERVISGDKAELI